MRALSERKKQSLEGHQRAGSTLKLSGFTLQTDRVSEVRSRSYAECVCGGARGRTGEKNSLKLEGRGDVGYGWLTASH